jgi:hypothetical protein
MPDFFFGGTVGPVFDDIDSPFLLNAAISFFSPTPAPAVA